MIFDPRRIAQSIAMVAILTTIVACSGKARKSQSAFDTPLHHTSNGDRFQDSENYPRSITEYDKALALDPKFSPALAGKAVSLALLGQLEAAEDLLDDAKGLPYHIASIRVLTVTHKDGYLKQVQRHLDRGTGLDPDSSALWFYAALAFRDGLDFEHAVSSLKEVLRIDGSYTRRAGAEWKKLQRVERSQVGTVIGKQIALLDKIDRADIAALFIQELRIDRIFKQQKKQYDTSFKPPADNSLVADKVTKMLAMTDIGEHVLQTDIEMLLDIGIRGLEPFPDHTFRPDQRVSRAEFAIMLEDVLIRVTGDFGVASKYFGSSSPFPDVRNDHPAYNAIMIVTTRGFLEASTDGSFGLRDSVSGADALLAIRRIKDELKLD